MRSIIQEKTGQCYLCMKLHDDYSAKYTEEHHVFMGTKDRKMSERFGLKVQLCKAHHEHDGGPEAVHRNHEICLGLQREAQKAFILNFPDLNFRDFFSKSTMTDEEMEEIRQQATKKQEEDDGSGFILLEDEDED
jgi:hypothetical protein